MTQGKYRTAIYDKYVSVQMPEWAENNTEASAVSSAGTLRRLKGWLPPDHTAKCLDLGCGPGRLLLALRGAGYHDVSGVDVSPQSVSLARATGLQIAQADLRDYLLNSPGAYDLITAFDVIEHFHKDELLELFQLVRSRLAPDGRFIIQTPNASSPWAAGCRYGDLTHELIFNVKALVSLARVTGFGDVCAREVAPHIHGITSAVRGFGWRLIWSCCAMWNLIETGNTQGGIYTRNLVLLCINKKAAGC